MVPLVRQKIIERCEQEGAKTAFFPRHTLHPVSLEEVRKKALGQILGIVLTIASATEIGIKGIPISAAESLQGLARPWWVKILRGEHDTPVGRGKDSRSRLSIRRTNV